MEVKVIMMYIYQADNNNFGFKDSKINNIESTDIQISNDIYNQFFTNQSLGRQYILKNINGTTFDEIFQEVISQQTLPLEPSIIDRIKALEDAQLSNLGI